MSVMDPKTSREAREKGMERRQLTVMFVDLVGSTSLSRQVEPEDVLDLTMSYQAIVANCTTRYDGHVARVVGDGVLVLFGWPTAQENAPEAAVRTALAIHKGLEEEALGAGHRLQCRIGIATGLVLVGDIDGEAIDQTSVVFGDTPNLAARLQGCGEPGETIIAEATYLRISTLFDCRELAPQDLSGFEEPVRAFSVTGFADPDGMADEAERLRKSPMIGRDDELAFLQRKWQLACEGQGQIVVLTGEAGVGKSRLLHAQRHDPELGNHLTVTYHCSPFHTQSAYFPFATQTERLCGISRVDTKDERLDKLGEVFGDVLNTHQLNLLNSAMSPEQVRSVGLESISDEKYRRELCEIYLHVVTSGARTGPLLLHFEDVHWIDPSSRYLLETVSPSLAKLPVLLVLSQRPGPSVTFPDRSNVSTLSLEPLSDEKSRELIAARSQVSGVTAAVIEKIAEHTSGIPLFIEEYTSAISDLPHTIAETEAGVALPASLRDLFAERLDALAGLREIAVACAVIGRAFDLSVLSGIVNQDIRDTERDVDALVRLGILRPVSGNNKDQFQYDHVLVREASYGSLSRTRRRALHLRTAEVLETARPESARVEPEFLAYHFIEADAPDRAIVYWIKAAKTALQRFAYSETLNHVDRGMACLPRLAERQRVEAEIALSSMKGIASRASFGFGADRTMAAFQRAFDLADQAGDTKALLHAGHGLFTGHLVLADYKRAEEMGRRIGTRRLSDHAQLAAEYMIGVPLIWRGQFLKGKAALDKALDFGKDAQDRTSATLVNQVRSMLGLVHAFLGDIDQAIETTKMAVDEATAMDQPLTRANALQIACNAFLILNHPDCLDTAQTLETLAREHDLTFYSISSTSLIAAALLRHGETSRGYDLMQQGWDQFRATESRANQVLALTEFARGGLLTGNLEAGLSAAADGLALATRYDERNFESELTRIKAEILNAREGTTERAIETFQRAASIAKQQNAFVFELRAETCLARINQHKRTGCPHRTRLTNLLPKIPSNFVSSDLEGRARIAGRLSHCSCGPGFI